MNLVKIMFLFAMIKISISTCGEGCLSCTTDDTCLLCDKQNGFFLTSSNSCASLEIQNCLVYDVLGNCLQCKDYYYYSIYF